MRIAHFVSAFPVLSEAFVYDEIEAFAKEGFENVVVSLRPPPKEVRSTEKEKTFLGNRKSEDLGIVDILDVALSPLAGIKVFCRAPRRAVRTEVSLVAAAIGSPRESLRLCWCLQRAYEAAPKLTDLAVDHCHAHFAHYPASLAWACSRLVGTSFSFNAHGYDLYRYRAHLGRKIRDADLIFPISNKNREFLIEKGGETPELENRIETSRCGIDLAEYVFRSRSEKLPEQPLIVSVGRLVDIKGFSVLIEAIELLAKEGKNLRAEIVGEGPDRKRLERQILHAGLEDRIQLLGSLSRQETRLKQDGADLIVQPSRPGLHGPEGIPIVLVEAMALGVPVISTRFAAIPELVVEKRTGYLVDPADPRGLAQIVSHLLDNGVPQVIRANARKQVEQLHDGPANFQTKAQSIEKLRSHDAHIPPAP